MESTSESVKEETPHAFDPAALSRMPLASLLYCILIGDLRLYPRRDGSVETAFAPN
jgi:hypothetical protein